MPGHQEKIDVTIEIITGFWYPFGSRMPPRHFKCSLFYAWKTYSLAWRRQGLVKTLSRHHICDARTKSSRSLAAFIVLHKASNHKTFYAKWVYDVLISKKISKLHDWFKSYNSCMTVVPASHVLPFWIDILSPQLLNQPLDCDILLNLDCPQHIWHTLFYDWKPYVLA